MRRIPLHLIHLAFLFFSIASLAAPVTGPASAPAYTVATYTYVSTYTVFNPAWAFPAGTGVIQRTYQSGNTYYCDILWNQAGSGRWIKFYENYTTQLGNLNVTVVASSPPSLPVTTFTTDYKCGNTTVTRSGGSTSHLSYDLYWQTSATGAVTTLGGVSGISGEVITLTASTPLYLRARKKAAPQTWSVTSTFVGNIVVSSTQPPAPTSSTNGAGFKNSSVVLSVGAVSGATSYRWFDSGLSVNPIAETTGPSYTVSNLSNTQTYYVKSVKGCESIGRYPVTATLEPDPQIIVGGGRRPSIIGGQPITLEVVGSYATYSWVNVSTGTIVGTSPTFTVTTSGSYKVSVTKNGVAGIGHSSPFLISSDPLDQNLNFISTQTILVDNIRTEAEIYMLPPTSQNQVIQYFDGLGRPIQTVDVYGSPTYNDVVLHQAYDAFGRENKKFLPYTAFPGDGLYKTDAAAAQLNFYSTSTGVYNNTVKTDTSPFATAEFEASPLNRVLQQGAPGAQWQPGNKAVQFGYLVNKHGTAAQGEESLPIWSISAVTISSATEYIITTAANYVTGSLYINATTDENGKQVREYVDKQGKTIVKKVQYVEGTPNTYDDSHWAITYYIYDDFERLRFVLQPEFWVSKATYAGYSDNADKRLFLGKLAFEYRYDGRGRMVYKKVPGAEPVEMAYDQWDRLALSRDGKQKEDGKWFFTKYDTLNRPILTGEISNNSSWTTHQTELNTFAERFETVASGGVGYTTTLTYPTSVGLSDVYTITYYDDYTFKTNLTLGTAYDFAGTYFNSVKGLVTGTKERVLNSSPLQWLVSVNYYDDRYRIVYNVADDHLGNKNKTTNTYYGITNWVTTSTLVHGTNKLSTVTNTAYDHRGRVLNVTQTMDNTPAVMLVANKYNEIGELIEKNQHSTDGGNTFLQSVDHRYNIRGWLTHINNRQLSNDGTLNNDVNDLFGMELGYNTGVTVGSDNIVAQYNGNISSIAWKTNNLVDASEEKIYGFNYDPLNRLKDAKYAKRNGSYWNADVGMFNEDNISYDRNGNISHLDRKAKINGTSTYMDQLAYTYAGLGNQLSTVDDASLYDNPQAAGGDFGFVENTAGITEYAYDKNGNMKSDLNKGILSITYNHINLPALVELEPKEGKARTIAYTYSASGAKLKKLAKWGTETIGETDYVGGIHYEKGQLAFVQMGEGRALKNGTKWEYEYHLKDHLGNARVVYGLLQDVDAFLTTAESELASQEQSKFSNMGSQQRSTLFNRTQPDNTVVTPNESFELNGFLNKPIGPAKMLQVKSGERVTMEVFARSPVTVSSDNVIPTLATALTGAFGLGAGTEGYTALSNRAPVTAGLINRISGLPKAYLCYILFNSSYGFVQQGFYTVGIASQVNFEKLAMDIPVPVDGYMYIYIANESSVSSATSAYFDDFNVVHYRNSSTLKVNQVQDYYPFGLTFNSYQRESGKNNDYLYNGKELQTEFELGWLDYGCRMYMQEIGRWGVVDPMTDVMPMVSPYAYSLNNPIKYVDKDGSIPIIPLLLKAGANGAADMLMQVAMNYYFDNKSTTLAAAFDNVNWWQTSRSAAEGLIPWSTPGGRLGRAAGTAAGDVMVNALHEGSNYSGEQALKDFAVGFIGDLAGGGLGDLISKYGADGVARGLGKMGFDAKAIDKFTGILDWNFSSSDPLVGDLANSIDNSFGRGTVKDVESAFSSAAGKGDVDISLGNANIEVKSGGKMKLTQSLKNADHAKSQGKKYFLYMPKATSAQIKEAAGKGITVYNNQNELMKAIGN